MKQIDRELYLKCRENDWSNNLVSLFPDYNTYQKLGLGVVILRDGTRLCMRGSADSGMTESETVSELGCQESVFRFPG